MKALSDNANSSTDIWRRAIQPSRKTLGAAAARALLKLKLSATDLARADALARKASGGALTGQEERELEDYRVVGTAIGFLKSKARLSLKGL